jgi:hypothetical protein
MDNGQHSFPAFPRSLSGRDSQCFADIELDRADASDKERVRISTDRVLEEAGKFRVTIWDMSGLPSFGGIAQGRDDVSKRVEAGIDRDALLDPFSDSRSPLELDREQTESTPRSHKPSWKCKISPFQSQPNRRNGTCSLQ